MALTDLVTDPLVKASIVADRAWNSLTSRELQVATLLCQDISNREIAQTLQISIKTVDTHRQHAIAKLGVRSNVGILRSGILSGRVTLGA